MTFIRKHYLAILIALMFSVPLYNLFRHPASIDHDEAWYARRNPESDILAPLISNEGPLGRITRAFENAARAHTFSWDNLDKISYATPDTPGYGSNPQFEIFNPAGPFGHVPLYDKGAILPTASLRRIGTTETHIFFTLRHEAVKTGNIADTLFAIITHADPDICRRYEQVSKDQIGVSFPLKPNGSGVVPGTGILHFAGHYMCFHDSDGTSYLFIPITERFKRPGETTWQH